MNKLSEMIEELCPEGVEWRKLGEVCEVSKGTQFNKTDMAKTGSYPVINGGITPSGYVEIYNQEANTITISQGGASAGYVNWMTSKFFAGAHCYIITPSEQVSNRYLYHFLKSSEFELQKRKFGAGIPALAKSSIESLLLPLPPLAVQQAIVGILDKFDALNVQLEALLEAEKTAREKQYAYYRDKLLTFDSGVEWRKLGEVCTTLKKETLKKGELLSEGYPVINSGRELYGYYSAYNNEGPAFTVAARGEYAAYVNFFDGKFWAGGLCYPYTSNDENKIITKFIYYYLESKENFLMATLVARGGIPAINKSDLDNFLLPLPPLAVQQAIVGILDKFDALNVQLEDLLEAEKTAREKQYAYYRDKLLSFKQK